MRTLVILFIVASIPFAGCQSIRPSKTVEFVVHDEQGEVVSDAIISTGYSMGDTYGKGVTNEEGRFSFTGKVYYNLEIKITKEGYYDSAGEVWSYSRKYPYPPETIPLLLKKIQQPVPMYCHNIGYPLGRNCILLPEMDKPIGFDMVIGDWVTPYGKGKIADFVFTGTKDFDGKRPWHKRDDYRMLLKIEFSNPEDGIQKFLTADRSQFESELESPHEAPVDGYQSVLELPQMSLKANKHEYFIQNKEKYYYWNERNRYLFRIRTKTDDNGKIVSAIYGRTLKEIGYFWGGS